LHLDKGWNGSPPPDKGDPYKVADLAISPDCYLIMLQIQEDHHLPLGRLARFAEVGNGISWRLAPLAPAAAPL